VADRPFAHGSDHRETVASTHFVPGIDTLRFLAALWVVFYHGAAPPLGALVPQQYASIATALARLPFNGNAAVVLFFVISGFCIHLSNVRRERVAVTRFLVQRILRIVPPLVVIQLIAMALGSRYSASLSVVLWSVNCEIAYYLVYPFIFRLLRPGRIVSTTAVSLAISAVMACLNARAQFLWQWPSEVLTWIFCLSLWLLGCAFADRFARSAIAPRLPNVWVLRFVAVLFGIVATVLAHLPILPIGYVWTMPFFAAFCPVWIWAEITYARERGPQPLLEACGVAGYSIYLVHKPAITAVGALELPPLLCWPVILMCVAGASAVFYMVVERPSHLASRWAGRRLQPAGTGRAAHG
jgi:peptidoglycan/LPS O-acetylase OafA/YrhL